MPPQATIPPFGKTATLLGSNPDAGETLLEADLAALEPSEQWHPGAWVLSVQGVAVNQEANPAAHLATNPVIVEVQMGAGAATLKWEANVFPSFSVQLPAAKMRVNCQWDNFVTAAQAPRVTSVTIRGIVQRGAATTRPRRRFHLMPASSTAIIEAAVPAFAKTVQLAAPPNCPLWSNDSRLAFYDNPQGPSNEVVALARYHGATLKAILMRGQRLAIPPGASWWRFHLPLAAHLNVFGRIDGFPYLDFELEF